MFFPFVILSLFIFRVLADFSLSLPGTSQSYSVSSGKVSVKVAWKDDNTAPAVDDVDAVTLVLCTGSNSQINAVTTLKSGLSKSDLKGNSYTVSIPASAGASGAYYIQLYSTYGSGYSIHYTNRFSLQGMTGSLKPSGSVSDKPPSSVKNTGGNNEQTAGTLTLPTDMSKSFTVPYTLQTGQIRFAPMQNQPGKSVTATTWSRKYPTSKVTYYSAFRTSLDCLSTVTPGWSYTRTSLINFASPAPNPAQEGSWYPASAKLVKPTLMTGSRFS